MQESGIDTDGLTTVGVGVNLSDAEKGRIPLWERLSKP
jgi:hypothetical protein